MLLFLLLLLFLLILFYLLNQLSAYGLIGIMVIKFKKYTACIDLLK